MIHWTGDYFKSTSIFCKLVHYNNQTKFDSLGKFLYQSFDSNELFYVHTDAHRLGILFKQILNPKHNFSVNLFEI